MSEPVKDDYVSAYDEGGQDEENLIGPEWLNAVADFVNSGHLDPLEAHRTSPAPHPAYDDMPDLTLLYENGLT